LLFDEIASYPKGFRVLTCSTSSPARLASILRLGDHGGHHAVVQALRGKPAEWQAQANGFDPVTVDGGAVLDNVIGGESLDLEIFPAPFWHEHDGGRYIGTGCCVVTRDLDSDWVNVGTYRVQLHDNRTVGLDMVPGKHGAIQYDKHMQAGEPFPVVIEGYAHVGDVRPEGPFGEFHGYYPGKAGTAPAVQVERIYYRNDPILMGSPPGKPPNDYSYSKAVMRSALLFDALQAAGVPDVEAVWAHEIGGARMFNVVAIKQRYAGHAKQAGHILNQCGAGAYMSRYSIVVDEDIDPADLQEVMWAVATRSDPTTDIDIIQRGMGSKNDPMFVAYPYDAPLSSKAVIDACRPYDHLHDFPAVAEASKALCEQTRKKWKDLF
jgi:3-polyprenyl-4-hydroxybenzoate decarboxylase